LFSEKFIRVEGLRLDNGTAGRLVAKAIQSILPSVYTVSDEPPKRGKDVDDYLKLILGIRQPQE